MTKHIFAAAFSILLAVAVTGCVTSPKTSSAPPATASNDGAITEKYWKLVELGGQPIKPGPNDTYITLKTDGNRLIGSGGCNRLTGSYELGDRNRVRFSQIALTRMACMEGMDTEQRFMDVLEATDNYTVNGDTLVLNKARMAPLARLAAVYMQ